MKAPENLKNIPWLAIGYQELLKGVGRDGPVDAHGRSQPLKDMAGHIQSNPRILEYFTAVGKKEKGEWTEINSWCSAFVNWCMRQSGILGTHSGMAKSWLHWHHGKEVGARVGAVVVFPRPPDPTQGHVAMVWAVHGDRMDILGGNQGGHAARGRKAAVSSHVSIEQNRKVKAGLGFFWPKNFPEPDA